ncbi:hypothetical protein [Schaalia suimastitidis]|uniref:carboxylate--amine ligase n=1 Tax=Schaalia suimastitidis TaxID=121163 RepID=UPI0006853C28|nr:hypothetical protein [Schaalia suimastitidis]
MARLRGLRYLDVPAPGPQFGRHVAVSHTGAPFRLLILGGDMGGLSQARSLYEAYRTPAQILAIARIPVHSASSMYEIAYEPALEDDDTFVESINRIARLHDTPLLLSSSFDLYIEMASRLRERFDARVIVPFAPFDVMERIVDKAVFAAYTQQLGIAHPATVIHRVGSGPVPDLSELGYPVVAKPAQSDALRHLDIDDVQKVYYFASRDEVDRFDESLKRAGFSGEIVFQRRVGGSDAQMRILTCYCTRDHQVPISAFGRVLIEEHDPNLRGNPALIFTGEVADTPVAQATTLLKELGWVGYANFDIKVDPHTGKHLFFEINPRLGRSNYYLNVSGFNPIEVLVEDWISGAPVAPLTAQRRGVYTMVPLGLALAYGAGDRGRLLAAALGGRMKNPLIAWRDRVFIKNIYAYAATLLQYRRFARHYPLAQYRAESRHL